MVEERCKCDLSVFQKTTDLRIDGLGRLCPSIRRHCKEYFYDGTEDSNWYVFLLLVKQEVIANELADSGLAGN